MKQIKTNFVDMTMDELASDFRNPIIVPTALQGINTFLDNHVLNDQSKSKYNSCQIDGANSVVNALTNHFTSFAQAQRRFTFKSTIRNSFYNLISSFLTLILLCFFLFMTKIVTNPWTLIFFLMGTMIVLYIVYAIHYEHSYREMRNDPNPFLANVEYYPEMFMRIMIELMKNEESCEKTSTTVPVKPAPVKPAPVKPVPITRPMCPMEPDSCNMPDYYDYS